jgi:predicted glycogen debranching enzyme
MTETYHPACEVRLDRADVCAGTLEDVERREWLVTNGLGGYASGRLIGGCSRRYHGGLIAAFPPPLGRTLMLAELSEEVDCDGRRERLSVLEEAGVEFDVPQALAGFRLIEGLPVWTYRLGELWLEKQLMMVHLENTTLLQYRLLGGPPVTLVLRPWLSPRSHDAAVTAVLPGESALVTRDGRIEVPLPAPLPPLRLRIDSDDHELIVHAESRVLEYRVERSRGYEHVAPVSSPGELHVRLKPGTAVTLTVSTESWTTLEAMSVTAAFQAEHQRRRSLLDLAHPLARTGMAASLVLAADQFVIAPTRTSDEVLAHASGDEPRSVIAGYHWFTDWGRDTMISLEGLTLFTGRHQEAAYILRTFARHVKDGLIPNMFPEGESEGLYHTADATLWFFQALARYLAASGDRVTLRGLLPVLEDIVEHHVSGTRFGIGVDAADGLLRQGAEGYQLTWMDAKVGDWVVTPRRGKAVEINALWYNALRLLAGWLRSEGRAPSAARLDALADRARTSFARRFWYDAGGYLYDVVDGERGDDPSLRPNQLFAIALEHPILDNERWPRVVDVVQQHLLTPVGLRSLAPGQPAYCAKYDGDLRARDAAYHQGTVWSWLIGPFVDAWLKTHPGDPSGAFDALRGVEGHLSEACIGTINEIFDAQAPFVPRGCVAQAWSVAEALRSWIKVREHLSAHRANSRVG